MKNIILFLFFAYSTWNQNHAKYNFYHGHMLLISPITHFVVYETYLSIVIFYEIQFKLGSISNIQ